MSKIKIYESATININQGRGEIHIHECLDGTYNIEIVEHSDNLLRLGFRESHGITYKYLESYKHVDTEGEV